MSHVHEILWTLALVLWMEQIIFISFQLGKYKFSNTNLGTSLNMFVVVLIIFNSSTVLLLVLHITTII